MSAILIMSILGFALFAYALTGGADFGVGILESFSPEEEQPRLRSLGEKAIAPIWEANHIWIILALVIVFVAYPEIHVLITTSLHIPLLLLLSGIILRGTAFTFRYYDRSDDPATTQLWSVLFRSGSLIVPFFFGHLAAALYRGRILSQPTTVWETYLAPWIGVFPLFTGIFTVVLFGWIAAIFLVGEVTGQEREHWLERARRWTAAMVVSGALVTVAAWHEEVDLIQRVFTQPLALSAVLSATVSLALLWPQLLQNRMWLSRALVGSVVGSILMGYLGARYPIAIQLADAPSITWTAALAPQPTLDALALILVLSSLVIFPALAWLYAVFKKPEPL